MAFLENLKTLLKTEKRSEKTIYKIISNLKTMADKIGIKEIESLDYLKEYDTIKNAMSAYTLRSFKTYVASAFVALEVMGDTETSAIYKTKMKELRNKIDKEDDSNIANDRQKERMVGFDKLVETRDAFKEKVEQMKMPVSKKEYQDIQAYMVLCMATMCDNIMRNQELCKMVVVKEWNDSFSKDRNYFIYNMNQMHIYVYKTAKQYGNMTIVLSDELSEIIKDCLSMRPDIYNNANERPFLINESGSTLSICGGLQRLYERAGLPATPTIIRNIVATHRSGSAVNDVKKALENAKNFGHSVKQHIRYIRFV